MQIPLTDRLATGSIDSVKYLKNYEMYHKMTQRFVFSIKFGVGWQKKLRNFVNFSAGDRVRLFGLVSSKLRSWSTFPPSIPFYSQLLRIYPVFCLSISLNEADLTLKTSRTSQAEEEERCRPRPTAQTPFLTNSA